MVISGIHIMNLQSIDLNLLLAFESLMDERNVTRAAKRIGLSQPAMSNALTRLRRTFNDPILVRSPEGMMPTPAAQALIGPIREALASLRAAIEEKPAFNPAASRRVFHLLTNDYAEIMLSSARGRRVARESRRDKLACPSFGKRVSAACYRIACGLVQHRNRIFPRRAVT